MYQIKTYNKISAVGLDLLDKEKYTVSDSAEAPVGAIVRSAALHEEKFAPSLIAIARAGAGTNNIPTDRCSEEGIVVFNTPGANANAVKELVIAGLFLSSRKIVSAIEWAKDLKGNGDAVGKLVEKGKSAFAGPEILGKKLGVIGLGAIGVLVANAACDLGMEVYGYDPYLSLQNAWNLSHNVIRATDMKDIFTNCDYISLHIPLNANTKGTINEKTLASMKDGVRILNFARDGLVNSADMIAALESGKVASYVVDFPTDEMIGVDGVVCIPHLGASTPESEDNCAVMAAEELMDYIENGNITHSVNLPDASMPRSANMRICVIHRNIPNMITSVTSVLANDNVNIENLLNKSKGDYAYTMLDVNECDAASVSAHIGAVEGIIRVRVI
ncbi:MAG: phosphoglycerate dehydrogenase [Clostridia bacterium]|nr:phosphoglycerate dehydrogenase [Clostridia bacterium]